ncbi:MAG: hypothetical protein LBE13_09830 [Bacteroidales bacterium]|jgi:hypothetical protein|nr:hypothetical protein [Bacteroidales bacterium]
MGKKLNELLITKVRESIPKNIKTVEYLIGKLNISKESAYRRMRGDIPFSFDEVTVLALDLNLSVDEIVGNDIENRVFFDLQVNDLVNSEESFLAMFKEYCKCIEKISKSKEKEMLISINRLCLFLLIKYDSLFKLFYYKWIHQTNNISVNPLFSKVIIPDEILAIKNKCKIVMQKLNNITFIVDRNMFLSIVREIQYYYSRKLISDKDMALLKQELINLINDMEDLMQKGCTESGSTYNFYLSMLDIETNTAWANGDDTNGSLFWIYSVNSVTVYNEKINYMHKKWIETLKKYSVLITQSNEILQVKFIDKQREHIENIAQDLSFYE